MLAPTRLMSDDFWDSNPLALAYNGSHSAKRPARPGIAPVQLLRELTRLQHEQGYLSDEDLRKLSARMDVPLYRLEGLVSFYPVFRRTPPPQAVVHVCRDVTCAMADCDRVQEQLKQRLADRNVEVHEVSCLGRCDAAVAVAINDIPVAPITGVDVDRIVQLVGSPQKHPDTDAPQTTSWKCDPYAGKEDYYATVKSLVSSADELGSTSIQRLTESRLRGMGGAGFPTGRKWDLVSREPTTPKYVICNADESEPGTFKDREILRQLPHLVIEGMLLAGLTIGAETGIIYLRHEYGPEGRALAAAIDEAENNGILGTDAAGSGKAFEIDLFISPGGYILGEETAMLEALEDKRGEPRNKPPYPGTHGLWGKPTLINNVETFALATAIIHHGSDWWDEQGVGDLAGLKFVSISGDVARAGVYEIPIGTTIKQLIELAGGMRDGRPLKAFLPGGASSNFLTAADADTPIDFDAIARAGSMLGTGAVIVMAEHQDLFALATNLVRFFRNESCGKCVPCRIGSDQAVQLLEGVQGGTVPVTDLDELAELGETLQLTSICGLGQVAINPVLSMLKHFPEEVPGG